MSYVLGVDVGKAELTAAVAEGAQATLIGTFTNSPDGFAALKAALPSGVPSLLVIEPTGGYELALAGWAVAAGWQVSRPNPRQVRDWARSLGRRAKTDRQDALLLARYGAACRPPTWTVLPSEVSELESLLRRREDIEGLLRQERNRLQQLQDRPGVARAVPPSLRKVIQSLEEALEELEEAIAGHQREHPGLAEAAHRLQTVPGIGRRNSLWLVVALYRWSVLTNGSGTVKGFTAFLGLDPTPRESGSSVRGRSTISRMGMKHVRRMLYLGALGGIRGNNPLRRFYDRLVAAHKPKILALVAAARKLACWAWALFQSGTTFDPARLMPKTV